MKGCPQDVVAPMGPWYEKVNTLIAAAKRTTKPEELRRVLGDPDDIEYLTDEERMDDASGQIDKRHPSEIWVYSDPYRPRIQHRFGISDGHIIAISRVTKVPST